MATETASAAMRVGLIGLGAIGLGVCRLARQLADGEGELQVVGALVRDVRRPRGADTPPVVGSLAELLALRPEVVVEAGGHAALRAYGVDVLRAGCDLVTVSMGALAEGDLLDELCAAARAGGSRIQMPSGAIGGLDALGAAAVGQLARVTHTTTKPAHTLLPPEEAASLSEPREVYRGAAREAAVKFPESVNVMAAVSLAGVGLDRTEVQVVADPRATRNRHVVTAEGAFGAFRFEIENVPSPENPRTGLLTAMSVFHALRRRRALLSVG